MACYLFAAFWSCRCSDRDPKIIGNHNKEYLSTSLLDPGPGCYVYSVVDLL